MSADEFRALRGFIELPQNMHTDSVGLHKLVSQLRAARALPVNVTCYAHVGEKWS